MYRSYLYCMISRVCLGGQVEALVQPRVARRQAQQLHRVRPARARARTHTHTHTHTHVNVHANAHAHAHTQTCAHAHAHAHACTHAHTQRGSRACVCVLPAARHGPAARALRKRPPAQAHTSPHRTTAQDNKNCGLEQQLAAGPRRGLRRSTVFPPARTHAARR